MSWAASENFRPGDIIRIEWNDEGTPYAVETQVMLTEEGSHVVYSPGKTLDEMKFVSWYESYDKTYTVTMVKQADLPLPSEPGLYAHSANVWSTVYRLTTNGAWRIAGTDDELELSAIKERNNQAPLHLLVVSD